MRILFVEDNIDLAYIGSRYLQSDGYQVTLAQSGKEALGILTSWKPNIIFLDLTLPDMKPEELKAALQPILSNNNISLVLASGRDDIGHWARSFETSFYIFKPYSRANIIEVARVASMQTFNRKESAQ